MRWASRPPGLALVKPDRATKCWTMYRGGEFDVVTLVYSSLQVGRDADPHRAPADPGRWWKASGSAGAFYDYEPDEDTILEALLPQNISVQLLTALLENQAGFFASQMAAMDNATRNAGDLIKALTIQMNRTRQAQDHQGADRNHLRRRRRLRERDMSHARPIQRPSYPGHRRRRRRRVRRRRCPRS